MLIAYHTIFQTIKQEHDTQPQLYAGDSGMGIMVSLSTSDFEVRHKGGKAEVSLARHLTPDECRALGPALIDAADNNERSHAQWEQQVTPCQQDDDVFCPACDGSGKVG
jgi:hypothetical protein